MKTGLEHHGNHRIGAISVGRSTRRPGQHGLFGMPFMLKALDAEVEGAALMGHGDKFSRNNLHVVEGARVQVAKPDVVFSLLAGNIGHLVLNSFADDMVVNRFAAVFDRVSQTGALIVDLRNSGAGNSGNAWKILAYLMDKPFNTVRWMGRAYAPVRRGFPCHGDDRVLASAGLWSASVGKPYGRPVTLLVGPQTGPAGEDFVVTFEAAQRGAVVGEPTGRDGTGLQPQQLVCANADDLRAGRDTVLQTAWQSLATQAG